MKTLPINNPEALIPFLTKPSHQLFYAMGLKTGFRVSELLSLKVKDVFYSTGELRSLVTVERRNMKGKNKSRSVPLSEQSRKFIKEHSKVDLNYLERPLFDFGRIAANLFLDKARKRAGIEQRIACHSMRKTFAAKVYSLSGCDLTVTQKAMGHASINSTIQYLEVDQDKLNKVFENL